MKTGIDNRAKVGPIERSFTKSKDSPVVCNIEVVRKSEGLAERNARGDESLNR